MSAPHLRAVANDRTLVARPSSAAAMSLHTAEILWTRGDQPFIDKLDLKKFYSLQTPRSYINCTEDTALPPGEWGWHPRMSNRLGLYRLVQIAGGHETMFTAPERLAAAIIEAGRD